MSSGKYSTRTLSPELIRLLPEKTISTEVGEPDALLEHVPDISGG